MQPTRLSALSPDRILAQDGVPDTRRQQPESALRAYGDDTDRFEDVSTLPAAA
jgi:hypothetical protein